MKGFKRVTNPSIERIPFSCRHTGGKAIPEGVEAILILQGLRGWRFRDRRPTFILRSYSTPVKLTTLELRNYTIPAVLVACAVLYFWTLADVAALAFAAFGLLVAISFAWSYRMAKGVGARRNLLSAAVQVGDEIEEEVELINQSILPLIWAEFVDRSTLPGLSASVVAALGGNSRRKWTNRTVCSLRGIYEMGPWELQMGDPFGVFIVRQTYQDHRELVVYPPLAEIPADLLPQSSSQGDAYFYRSPIKAESTKAFTTRPYIIGDPMRHIHWPTTARRDGIFVKGFEPEARSVVWLLPDLDADSHVGTGIESTEEKLIILIASLAEALLRRHLSVGLFSYMDNPVVIEPAPGLAQLWRILRTLASLHTTKKQKFPELMQKAAPLILPGQLLIPVTPAIDTDWVNAWRASLDLGKAGLLAILLIAEPRSSADVDQTVGRLLRSGVQSRAIHVDQILPIEASYGAVRRWEFKTLALGKTIVVQHPRVASSLFSEGSS
ncbi:MAG: DUF58 domain-containing protein [Anaerolineales bacterium]|nr:MAG: DUF58 domain-containing protein [Anaerolineales bacterium]